MAWSQVKGDASYHPTYNIKKLKMDVLPNSFEVITAEVARNLFSHVDKVKNTLMAKHQSIMGTMIPEEEEYEESDGYYEDSDPESDENDIDLS